MAGKFSEDPQVIWVTDPDAPDRYMQLTIEFWYKDHQGKIWIAPKNMKTNGASIPRALWTLVGSPFTGDYRRAAIIHDQACIEVREGKGDRRSADRMFYHACRDGGCSIRDAIILYVGVRVGSVKKFVPAWDSTNIDFRPRLVSSSGDENMMRDFCASADEVLNGGEVDDIDEIERRTDEALSLKAGIAAENLT